MKALITEGIILSRTNYGEADRILTVLTPDNGKLRLMARGVRKIKSKLAGGVELFSISELSYIRGKNEIGTLVSSRLKIHYGNIIEDMDRVQLGYELIKLLNRVTEDSSEDSYFKLLGQSFEALNSADIDIVLIRAWFHAQLLKLAGHTPNLTSDQTGQPLNEDKKYSFDMDAMVFIPNLKGLYRSSHIKVLRLFFGPFDPKLLSRVQDPDSLLIAAAPQINNMLEIHII